MLVTPSPVRARSLPSEAGQFPLVFCPYGPHFLLFLAMSLGVESLSSIDSSPLSGSYYPAIEVDCYSYTPLFQLDTPPARATGGASA